MSNDANDGDASIDRPHLGPLGLAALTSAFVGLNAVWNYGESYLPRSFLKKSPDKTPDCFMQSHVLYFTEVLFSTPRMLALGLPKSLVGLFWIGGPLSGMTIQPLVGAICDELESSWGRRRPFLAGSALLAIFSIAWMALSTSVWSAALAFQLLNIAANGLEASCRGLVMDTAPTLQQPTAWAVVSFSSNVGTLTISLLGGLNFEDWLQIPGMDQFQIISALGVLIVAVTVTLTCFTVKEVPYRAPESKEESGPETTTEQGEQQPLLPRSHQHRSSRSCFTLTGRAFSKAFGSLLAPTIPLVSLINIASFWGWGAGAAVSMFGSAWAQTLTSDPALGLRAASLASAAATLLSMLGNVVLPAMASRFRIKLKWFWVFGALSGAVLLALGPLLARDLIVGVGILAGTGLYWCTITWVPFALLGELVSASTDSAKEEEVIIPATSQEDDEETVRGSEGPGGPALVAEKIVFKAGESVGVLNFYQSVPQLLTIVLSTLIMERAEGDGQSSLGSALQVGGAMALVSAWYAARVPEEQLSS